MDMELSIASSTSSDSDLEAKFVLNAINRDVSKGKINFNKCIICQESNNLLKATERSKQKFIASLKIRFEVSKGHDTSSNVNKMYGNFNEIKQSIQLYWHKYCYSGFTSSKNIAVYRKKFEKCNLQEFTATKDTLSDSRISRSLHTFNNDRCMFCQKRSHKKKLCQVMTKNTENKIRQIAKKNSLYFSRIGNNDLIAMEIKYHVNCLILELKKNQITTTYDVTATTSGAKRKCDSLDECFMQLTNELTKGFEKRKAYETTAIYRRFLEIGGDITIDSRSLLNKVLNHFRDKVDLVKPTKANESRILMPKLEQREVISSYIKCADNDQEETLNIAPSEAAILHKICHEIKNEMSNIESYKQLKDLRNNEYKRYIPEKLFLIISLLISDEQDDKEINVINICQDIIYAFANGKKHTPKHVGLGLLIHQETRSKKLIEALHNCGHSISYKETLRIRNTIAQEQIQSFLRNDNVVIPNQLVSNRFIQFAADNIDILEDTLDKAPSFHGTQLAVFQRGPPNPVHKAETFNMLPFRVQLEIPEDFHCLDKSNFHKSIKKQCADYPNKQDVIERINDSSYIRNHNMAWAFCRLQNSNSNEEMRIPQWTGFNRVLLSNTSNVTTYGYLPLLPHVASLYDTVWTVLNRCSAIARKLNNNYTVVTFDQAIYFKAKELQWFKKEELQHVIVRMGGFHIMLNFLRVIGQHMENSGLCDVWLESGLYGQATIDGILKGKKWSKGVRAHKLTYESLLRILLSLFEKWLAECKSNLVHSFNLMRLLSGEITQTFYNSDQTLPQNFKSMTDIVSTFTDEFTEFIESQTPTFKYWYSYLELVEILLEFNMAERSGNWDLHLSSFRRMLPWFFVYDHTNYSRWGTVYYLDMSILPTEAPEVYREFKEGNFVVKRLEGNFNQLSTDQALEHINRRSKDAGGIVGLTKQSTRLDEWFLSYNDIGVMIENFTTSLKMKMEARSQNIELGSRRMQVDEISVLKLQNEFTRFNVFTRQEDSLICISTNEVAPTNVEAALVTAHEKGENLLNLFIGSVGTDEFYKPLKKVKSLTLKPVKMVTKSKENSQRSFQQGQEYLQKILAAKEKGREINYEEVFQHELTVYPMALAPAGVLNLPSNKCALGNIIETFTNSYNEIPPIFKRTVHIIDGMSMIQALGKPTTAKTFGDYAKIVENIVFKNRFNAERIDVVMDHYKEMSIKDSTRIKRGLKGDSINRIIDNSDTLLPQQWHLFIHSVFNKKQLTNFVSQQLYAYSTTSNLQFVTSGGFYDITEYKANYPLNTDLLISSHEEADTRILLHILQAKLEGYSRCIVDCKDTDVLVLLAHFKDQLTEEVWVKVGTKDTIRFIAVHEIRMNPNMLKNLPAFHALSGCDTTSQFVGLGKTLCWKTFLLNYNLLNDVGSLPFTKDVFENVHRFVLKLYTSSDISSINHLRSVMAGSKTINKLPPTENSLYQHFLRVNYQTYIWINSLTPMPSLPDPVENGWIIIDGKMTPVLSTKPSMPSDKTLLSTCNCKKGCGSLQCSCAKKKLPCIGSCKCMGQKPSCSNPRSKETLFVDNHKQESSDSDSE